MGDQDQAIVVKHCKTLKHLFQQVKEAKEPKIRVAVNKYVQHHLATLT